MGTKRVWSIFDYKNDCFSGPICFTKEEAYAYLLDTSARYGDEDRFVVKELVILPIEDYEALL